MAAGTAPSTTPIRSSPSACRDERAKPLSRAAHPDGDGLAVSEIDSLGAGVLRTVIAAAVFASIGYVSGSRLASSLGTWSVTSWGITLAALVAIAPASHGLVGIAVARRG